ncbi:hypothetical protein MNBD_DELTA03-547 [hydrothermal vent metagenome]|uniref:Cytochrome c domain-containing protein n=1 Tax=hydrothermal vent metagenome TaxID=652676 RepID=A0A3B0UX21_9ZZZZ
MKNCFLVMCAAFFLFVSSSMALSSPLKRYDPATKTCRIFTHATLWEGYKVFVNNCKVCHHRGNKQGAKFLYTESKVRKAWNRVFAERYPICAKNGSWSKLSQEQIARLNDYLYKNAAGTYDPYDATDCG